MFSIGQEIVLELNRMSAKCAMRGWKLRPGGGYILTDKPGPKAKFIPPVPGDDVVARLEENGVIYGFSTVFVEVLKKSDLMLLAVRDEVVSKALRSQERYSCLIPMDIATISGEPEKGFIYDISMGGIRFMGAADLHLPIGSVFQASFHPGGLGKVENMVTEVVRTNFVEGQFRYAAKVEKMTPKNEGVMRQYMEFCGKWFSRHF